MQKASLLSLAVVSALISATAMASNPAIKPGDRSTGSGVSTDPSGARVRPGFTNPGGHIVVKAGAASSTSCQDRTGYSPQTWSFFDIWGSFYIARPADVVGAVRYCVSVQSDNTPSFAVKYDATGM
ncbi:MULTISPECIES: hypothetical protein [Luteibacter]|jgi:hypothetical protein|uniref:hypothetical protein n=1 Tax=Luteibacter sp. dw_328 TaxID=2719796 RepID=UPI0007BEADE7|nr:MULTISPECIES: hypothetical protein [Luteibacter]